MSRVIKFRAWDSKRKKMLTDAKWLGEYQQLPVMQFTGLLDANGAEIYEGDYVSIFARDDNEFMMCGVVKFGFRGYPGFDIYTRGDNTYSDEYNTFTNDDDLYFKVVGNKYQNPELLK